MGNPLLDRAREHSYAALLERGLKLTKPRQAVLDFFFDHPQTQFQPEDIHLRVNHKSPGLVSRPTVYRTLDLLCDAEIVTRTIVNSNSFRYQLAASECHSCHYHLVDVTTGAAVSFDADPELKRVLQRICRERGFAEQYHVLKVYGEFSRRRRGRSVAPSNGSSPEGTAPLTIEAGNC